MSENKSQGDRIPTNDEIVEDLVNNLQNSALTEDDLPTANIPEHLDESDDELYARSSIPDDFIDEKLLAEQNSELTDEEKLANKEKSTELKTKGNDQFRSGDYLDSIKTYTEALKLCPLEYSKDRSVYYCNRAASKVKLQNNASAIDDCSKAIELDDKYTRAYLRRAKLYEDTDKLDDSLEDYKKVLELDPGNTEATGATFRLPPIINERNEKMKTEMLGKLKEVGNLFLKPFGLSTDNFQMQQDPTSGGYSINFQQNQKN